MIERFYNQFTPECDSCGKKLAGQESRRDARRITCFCPWHPRETGGRE